MTRSLGDFLARVQLPCFSSFRVSSHLSLSISPDSSSVFYGSVLPRPQPSKQSPNSSPEEVLSGIIPFWSNTNLNSGLKPRRYYQVNKDTMDVLFSEMANVANFLVLEFQRLLFAEKTHHTGLAFIISFFAYKLVRYIPLWGLTLMGTIMAFSIPPLYLRNQEVIDHHIHSAQSLAAEKAAYARDVAGQQVGVVSERAKFVTSEWGKKAGVELPWSPTKSPAAPPKVTTTSSTMGPSSATGVDSLHGLNVPQTTPQKRVDPAKVPLPETPAPVNAL